MLNKAYLEITNACNLSCSFCHGTRRPVRYMTEGEFTSAAEKLAPHVKYLYFHLMGEPLLHPKLEDFLRIADGLGLRSIITTNGTLLSKRKEILLQAPSLHKVSISLHAYEGNEMREDLNTYLNDCFSFCASAAEKGIIAVMRLWNKGGEDRLNGAILEQMHAYFYEDSPWKETYSGYKVRDKVFLEWGERFEWPDEDKAYLGNDYGCYGLRDQIGILADGTVVPCCLDAEGAIPLGNIFTQPLREILDSPRACAIRRSFEQRQITEKLCQRCGYAHKKRY